MMRQGNLLKEKTEHIRERFTTEEGLVEFFTATAVWYFIVVEYIETWNDSLAGFWNGILPFNGILAQYIAKLTLSIIFTIIGLGITYVIVMVYRFIKKNWKRWFK